jgi:hypothetical protein
MYQRMIQNIFHGDALVSYIYLLLLFHSDADNEEVTNLCFISKDPHRFYGSTPSYSLSYYIYIQILQHESGCGGIVEQRQKETTYPT